MAKKMSKAKARKRLLEAEAKFQKVYMAGYGITSALHVVNHNDMEAVSKIVARCIKRIR